jgi:heparan-alpha-glucosaminide N-acetyltransferase
MGATAAVRPQPLPGTRVLSIDLLRGLDVLLMLFVNEIAGVRGAPSFILHAPPGTDGMTITDVVFPAFLFIVGMAVPFALGGRLRRGAPPACLWRHVLARTLALLVIGVLMVNGEQARDGLLSAPAWIVLMTVAVVLAWPAPAADVAGRRRQRALRAVGFALVLASALLYRGGEATGLVQIRPHWWGILGLIGWSYLVGAGLFLLAGDRPGVLAGFVSLLYCLYLADVAGGAAWLVAARPVLNVGSVLGSHGAVVLAGTVLGLMVQRHQREAAPPRRLVAQALAFCAALAAAGLLLHELKALHPAFWISKGLATPPWCLLSSAITGTVWVAVYWIVDVRGWRRWPPAVVTAGANALVAYLLAPFLLSLFALSAGLIGTNLYGALGENVWTGTLRSGLFAWAVVRLCGFLQRSGVRMRL